MTQLFETKHYQLQQSEANCLSLKSLFEEKDREIQKLQEDNSRIMEECFRLSQEKQGREKEMAVLQESKNAVQLEVQRLSSLKEHLDKFSDDTSIKQHNVAEESSRLYKRIEKLASKKAQLQRDLEQAKADLEKSKSIVQSTKQELDKISSQFEALKTVSTATENKLKETEENLQKITAQYKEAEEKLQKQNHQFEEATNRLQELEHVEVEQKQNAESLQAQLAKCKEDLNLHKKILEAETTKRLGLEKEQKRLERDAFRGTIEARSANRELQKLRGSKEILLENSMQMSTELEALKNHSEVLESHNFSMQKELDRFVETNEKARQSLDRKKLVDYLKRQNIEEAQRSCMKVHKVQSPERRLTSPLRSPYTPKQFN